MELLLVVEEFLSSLPCARSYERAFYMKAFICLLNDNFVDQQQQHVENQQSLNDIPIYKWLLTVF